MSRDPIIEKNLCFEFGPRWTTILQWERCLAFREGMRRSPEPHTMDIIAVLEARIAYFIEVKDYWTRSRSSEKRSLPDELDLKVRSTVAALVGAHRQSKRPDSHRNYGECAAVYAALVGDPKPRVVLWYEAPLSELTLEENRRKRGRVAANAMTERLKELRWLDIRPMSVGQSDEEDAREDVLPDVRVRRLPSQRRDRVDELCKSLKERFHDVPDEVLCEVLWYVEDRLEPAELDDLERRVANLRDPRQLLSPRK